MYFPDQRVGSTNALFNINCKMRMRGVIIINNSLIISFLLLVFVFNIVFMYKRKFLDVHVAR